MNFFVQRSELRDLYDKVAAGERISEADALRLFESKDLNALGAIADLARQKKVGNRASFIINRYINYSNYCILSCQFCSFARKKRDADGFELTIPLYRTAETKGKRPFEVTDQNMRDTVNLLVDILYAALDPRVKLAGGSA